MPRLTDDELRDRQTKRDFCSRFAQELLDLGVPAEAHVRKLDLPNAAWNQEGKLYHLVVTNYSYDGIVRIHVNRMMFLGWGGPSKPMLQRLQLPQLPPEKCHCNWYDPRADYTAKINCTPEELEAMAPWLARLFAGKEPIPAPPGYTPTPLRASETWPMTRADAQLHASYLFSDAARALFDEAIKQHQARTEARRARMRARGEGQPEGGFDARESPISSQKGGLGGFPVCFETGSA